MIMEWINVHEQLPEPGQHVIAYCHSYPKSYVSMVRFEKGKDGFYFWNDAIDQKGSVSHWMPFPEPPE